MYYIQYALSLFSPGLTGTLTRTLRLAASSGSASSGAGTLKKEGGMAVYPGITAVADDCSIQGISYAKKDEMEFQKIKRRLSMKVKRVTPIMSVVK